jgi:transposase
MHSPVPQDSEPLLFVGNIAVGRSQRRDVDPQHARKLIGYAPLAPTVKQSGQSSWTARISEAGSPTLRWAAIEAARHKQHP